jgi:hypothetical protein
MRDPAPEFSSHRIAAPKNGVIECTTTFNQLAKSSLTLKVAPPNLTSFSH